MNDSTDLFGEYRTAAGICLAGAAIADWFIAFRAYRGAYALTRAAPVGRGSLRSQDISLSDLR